ncbi:MAG: MATE family efflux transporter [Acidobacteriia bacterium]|nr:MATE family efflux transporter [Terriglobia bacterium]
MVHLAAPLVLAELGWMAMGVVDTMMVGRLSAESIGAVSLGTTALNTIGIFAGGLLLGLDTFVAQSYGAGDRADCRRSLINGVWLAIFLMLPVMALIAGTIPVLGWLGIDPAVMRETRPYIAAIDWSIPPLLLYFGIRRYLQSVNIVRPVMLTLVSANLVNLAGNWIFVFGHLGMPRFGTAGSGWSTCISRVYMAASLAYVAVKHDPDLLHTTWRPDFKRMRALLVLGLPAAGQIAVETAVFAAATVLIARLSATALASHQIVLTTISTTFMMPLGISSAAAVRVGQAIGRGDLRGASHAGWSAIGLGAVVMSGAALALISIPHWIARIFTPDAALIGASVVLLRICAFFQLFDGFQVVATGALRGTGDTHTAMICHFTGYWVIGLPVGAWLCFHYGMGAAGLWIGLSLGLILIGAVLLGFWTRTVRRFHPVDHRN